MTLALFITSTMAVVSFLVGDWWATLAFLCLMAMWLLLSVRT